MPLPAKPKRFPHCVLITLLLAAIAGPVPAEPLEAVELSTLDWPPYVGSALPENGATSAIIREAFARSGLPFEPRFLPWARAFELAKQGVVAGVFPEYYDAGRTADFVYSDPFPGGPVGLYRRKKDDIQFSIDPQTDQEAALRGLADKQFGVVRGYANTETFDTAEFLKKDLATTDAMNLRKLAYSRVDLIVIDHFVAAYLLADELKELADELVPMQPPLEIKDLYIAFSKAHPEAETYRQAFNRGLAQMREDGSLQALLKRFGF